MPAAPAKARAAAEGEMAIWKEVGEVGSGGQLSGVIHRGGSIGDMRYHDSGQWVESDIRNLGHGAWPGTEDGQGCGTATG
jgi:hypothetical protein